MSRGRETGGSWPNGICTLISLVPRQPVSNQKRYHRKPSHSTYFLHLLSITSQGTSSSLQPTVGACQFHGSSMPADVHPQSWIRRVRVWEALHRSLAVPLDIMTTESRSSIHVGRCLFDVALGPRLITASGKVPRHADSYARSPSAQTFPTRFDLIVIWNLQGLSITWPSSLTFGFRVLPSVPVVWVSAQPAPR